MASAPDSTIIEAYPKNARTPVVGSLMEVREERDCLLDDKRREPHKFKVVSIVKTGVARKSGRKQKSFIDSVLSAVNNFYESVVQDLTPWQPPAPKLKREAQLPDESEFDTSNESERDGSFIGTPDPTT